MHLVAIILFLTLNCLCAFWCINFTTGCTNKNNPLGKNLLLFIYRFYRWEFRLYMQEILLQYFVLFKNYAYLNLKNTFF